MVDVDPSTCPSFMKEEIDFTDIIRCPVVLRAGNDPRDVHRIIKKKGNYIDHSEGLTFLVLDACRGPTYKGPRSGVWVYLLLDAYGEFAVAQTCHLISCHDRVPIWNSWALQRTQL